MVGTRTYSGWWTMNKTTARAIALGTVASIAVGAVAFAQFGPRGGHGGFGERGERGDRGARIEMLFERADLNGDGALTMAEIEAARAEVFAEMDADGSGGVDAAELAEWRIRQTAERAVSRRDADGDGVLSLDEIPFRAERLARFDLDENGEITRTELEAAMERGRFGRGGRRDGGGRDE